VLVTTRGPATVDGLRQVAQVLLELEEKLPGGCYLLDHRLLDFSGVSGESLRERARDLRTKTGENRVARVASVVGTTADYGLVRMMALAGDYTFELRPFLSLEEARAWLAGD
jgi:hypothetical protein